ncbi:MAG TPA: hypothetical protein VHC20_03285, partial [Candidatus Paceibacterota bacterium]|nr:hypothetical protein [Candidatus Paceibacterota bacterium]
MRTEYVLAVKEEWVDGVYCFDRSVGPVLDWTDNREKDPLDESHRPAHLLCAHDGLGGKLFALGEAALDQFDLRWVADPYLTRLRDQTQQTALLSVPANGEAVVLACVEFRDRLAITSRPGNRPPPHCSSQGRIALAFADEEARRRVLSRKLTAFT